MSDQADFSRRALLVLPPLLLLSYVPCAQAGQCVTNGPRYKLESDVVEWRMTIRSSENCIRGVRFSYVYNATVRLVSLPLTGQVTVVGSGFSYTTKPNFRGEDSFAVGISGSKNKTNGYSTIRVLVSVIGFNEDVRPAFARFDPN